MAANIDLNQVVSELKPSLLWQVSGERLTYDPLTKDAESMKVVPASKWRAWWWKHVHRPGIRAEIQQDWTTVHHYAERALAYTRLHPPPYPQIDIGVATIALIFTYLDAAVVEGNLAQAWLYVNSADTFLPLVVPEDDLASCDLRLGIWDGSLRPDLQAVLNSSGVLTQVKRLRSFPEGGATTSPAAAMLSILHEADSELVGSLPAGPLGSLLATLSPSPKTGLGSGTGESGETGPKSGAPSGDLTKVVSPRPQAPAPTTMTNIEAGLGIGASTPPSMAAPVGSRSQLRTALHDATQVRTECWNEQNQQIRFAGYLWGLAGVGLFVTLSIAIGIAEYLVRGSSPVSGVKYPFFEAALLGLFGGALSAYMKATNVVIEISQYGLIAIYTLLRMLIGAAGAFVVIVAALALPLGSLSSTVATNTPVFVLVAIASGFSERLFIDALDQVAKNLGTVSKAAESMSAGKAGS